MADTPGMHTLRRVPSNDVRAIDNDGGVGSNGEEEASASRVLTMSCIVGRSEARNFQQSLMSSQRLSCISGFSNRGGRPPFATSQPIRKGSSPS